MSTWLAGRKTLHADVDEQAALDLAGDHAGDDVALVDGLHDLHPLFDLLGLALAEDDHAAIVLPAGCDVFDVFDEDADRSRRSRVIGSPSSHSLRGMMPSLL